jgi:hypothetical protein
MPWFRMHEATPLPQMPLQNCTSLITETVFSEPGTVSRVQFNLNYYYSIMKIKYLHTKNTKLFMNETENKAPKTYDA